MTPLAYASISGSAAQASLTVRTVVVKTNYWETGLGSRKVEYSTEGICAFEGVGCCPSDYKTVLNLARQL